MAVQSLGFSAFTVEGPGSIPGWGTKILQAAKCGHRKKKKKKEVSYGGMRKLEYLSIKSDQSHDPTQMVEPIPAATESFWAKRCGCLT